MPTVNLVDITSYSYNIENLELEYIASYLRDHFIEVNLSVLDSDKAMDKLVEDIDLEYDIFGFSTFFARITNIDIVFHAAKYIKSLNPSAKIFLCGRVASAAPKQILIDCEEIDFIILGDGQTPLLNVMNAINNNQDINELPSVITRHTKSYKKPWLATFENPKWPSRDLLEECINRNLFSARLLASHGCCSNCSFCCYNSYAKVTNTTHWVGRDMVDVYNELMSLYKKYNIIIFFFDDVSFEDPGQLGKQRILQFCNLVLSQSVKFIFHIYIRAETFTEDDIDLIQTMRKAGFYSVFIGIESANKNDLEIFNKKATVEDNKQVFDLFSRHGFSVNAGFIMLNPWSTKASISENFDFLCDIKFSNTVAYLTRLELYYGSDIYHRLKRENLLVENSTYRNIHNYIFVDPFINDLAVFISELFFDSDFLREERDYIVFYNAFCELDYLLPEKTFQYREKISALKNNYFSLLKDYFSILFKDYDLKTAKEKHGVFTESARKILRKFFILKFKIISDKELFPYFRRNRLSGK